MFSYSETYHFSQAAKEVRNWLAKAIQSELVRESGERDRGVKAMRFFVLRSTRMPAALVELPFITTRATEVQLRDAAYVARLGRV